VAEAREEVKVQEAEIEDVQGEAEIEDTRVIVISVPSIMCAINHREIYLFITFNTKMNNSGASQLARGLSVIFRL
jgi:hypothetical protein